MKMTLLNLTVKKVKAKEMRMRKMMKMKMRMMIKSWTLMVSKRTLRMLEVTSKRIKKTKNTKRDSSLGHKDRKLKTTRKWLNTAMY